MYIEELNYIIHPNITEQPLVLDLFAGCGGLSLGFETAGYDTKGYECVEAAVNIYNTNLQGQCYCKMLEVGFDYPDIDKIDIIIGGAPCQPFSRVGNQKGMKDARDGLNSHFLTLEQDRYIAVYEAKSHCINPRDLDNNQ